MFKLFSMFQLREPNGQFDSGVWNTVVYYSVPGNLDTIVQGTFNQNNKQGLSRKR